MGVGLYIHTDFGASWLAAAKPLPSTKQSTLATVLQDLYLCITTSYRDGGWLFWLILAKQDLLHATHASSEYATC